MYPIYRCASRPQIEWNTHWVRMKRRTKNNIYSYLICTNECNFNVAHKHIHFFLLGSSFIQFGGIMSVFFQCACACKLEYNRTRKKNQQTTTVTNETVRRIKTKIVLPKIESKITFKNVFFSSRCGMTEWAPGTCAKVHWKIFQIRSDD